MEQEWLTWIGLAIDLITAIATPVSIIAVIKQYKKMVSCEIKMANSSIVIHIVNECPYPILITDLLINKYSFLNNYIGLSGYEVRQIPYSYEAIKSIIQGRKKIIVVIECKNKRIRRKISTNEIKF